MSPEELGATVAAALAAVDADTSIDVGFGPLTADVAASTWRAAALVLRDDDRLTCTFFDWLSAYDDRDRGLAVATHVWSPTHRHHLVLRTHVPRDGGRLESLTSVWAGANWHERETFEMFGLVFDDHPNLAPLLLPDGFEGHPLRKDFVLASRVAKGWPGAKEPGESDHDVSTAAPGRRRMLPPGVPAPDEWGPDR